MRFVIIVVLVGVAAVLFMLATRNSDEPLRDQINPPATTTGQSADERRQVSLPVTVTPIEHASLVLNWAETTLYIDPVGSSTLYANLPPPDIILLTDIHGDHVSTTTLASVIGNRTTIVFPQAVKDMLPANLADRGRVLRNEETITLNDLEILAVPMYNLPETDDSRHPKGRGNGYLITDGTSRVYAAGDTSGTLEMRALTDIDLAFIPMNEPFTMGVEEAAEAVLAFSPARVYPYHYRTPEGYADVEEFKRLVTEENPEIEVMLLDWYPNSAGSEPADS